MAAATLDEFFPVRVPLCLGIGAPADLKSIGIGVDRPLRIMREALELARALLAGETVTVDGEFFHAYGRRLATGMRPVPLVLAAAGPRMLELAGAAADGVLISAGASVEFVERSLEHVHHGAKGRPVRTHAVVYAAVDGDESVRSRPSAAYSGDLTAGQSSRTEFGAGREHIEPVCLKRSRDGRDLGSAEALITDDIVRHHAASGRPEQVRKRVAAYQATGLDEMILSGARDGAQLADILRAL